MLRMSHEGRVVPTTFNSARAVLQMALLRVQLAGLHGTSRRLTCAYGLGRLPSHYSSLRGLCQALDSDSELIAQLKESVVSADRDVFGEDVRSVDELLLRAQTLVIEQQLPILCVAFAGELGRAGEEMLFVDELPTVFDVDTLLRGTLNRARSRWWLNRHLDNPTSVAIRLRDRLDTRYRRGIREAQADMLALPRRPALVHFLHEGTARTEWPEVSTPCELIASAIQSRSAPPSVSSNLSPSETTFS